MGKSTRRSFLFTGLTTGATVSALRVRRGGRGEADRGRQTDRTQLSAETSREMDSQEGERVTQATVDELLVGAHYYPWYGPGGHTDGLVRTPEMGVYDSQSRDVVERHRDWADSAGIDWLSASWWGPETRTDEIIRSTLAPALDGTNVGFAILYETVGRLSGEGGVDIEDERVRETLVSDFKSLERLFDRPSYQRIDGRPVVFVYGAREFRGDVPAAIDALRDRIDHDVYLLADMTGTAAPTPADRQRMRAFDGVNTYTIAGLAEQSQSGGASFDERLADLYLQWHAAADATQTDFFPTTIPGFETPDAEEFTWPATQDRFERVTEIASQHVDSSVGGLLVTSFNEWHESTAVEPDETSGMDYLRVLDSSLESTNSVLERTYEPVQFTFERTRVPAREDDRDLAYRCERIELHDSTGETVEQYDIGGEGEPLYGRGVYLSESNARRTWRWFGGPTASTVLYIPVNVLRQTTTLSVYGHAMGDTVSTRVDTPNRDGTVTLTTGWSWDRCCLAESSDQCETGQD
ncbi:glycoside hydrolase family 99-like domain-containing protein [Halorhabdus rudnickae]|uniref:glycoside hydrolase family 99-like domain-containing protein n=1 Tax=Halorhabdus rudnickae TaxID=1775544 RepID=UPI0014385DA4|nr:glycoside hydrolase family 99-like domain-containing protein [Halorhabdus rudnickae]